MLFNKLYEFWHRETSPPFLTKAQIVDHIISQLTVEHRYVLRNSSKDELPLFHFSWGMHIRNTYRLWDRNNPLTSRWVPDTSTEGVDCSPYHPDQVSYDIICTVWEKVNAETT